MYEPLGSYTDGMNRERNLPKVYAIDSYTVFRSLTGGSATT